ncbi:V-type H(+)-translocating pyrophosphatase, variant [Thecamonas trahens ATCC 50062]|uniref:H(+)-exporting diphosphatase n=1 Tax=Thecamonas trahens ATCC 50062 TaxID=461836 RepID=A0A0L0DT62_THETB|nr:V-type H(+)-translocating pyrophosphatase, variant [Thecamonas trahens ATCC 50062]KNC55539.1 V-type H(+)-translocating pyrophosphatase, variant [Thecamonas trahens ATCC 50062]|eukprot:XP_013761313.1 V-type H(+)-translocating pyrophosphatase, variant [Thecamonas trahens ATCC 50062]
MVLPEIAATLPLILAPALGFAFAALYVYQVSQVSLDDRRGSIQEEEAGLVGSSGAATPAQMKRIREITSFITRGARSFLFAEYRYMAVFIVVFGLIVLISLGLASPLGWPDGVFTAISFVAGAIASIVSGYIGMSIAVYANGRVAVSAMGPQVAPGRPDNAYRRGFTVAFKSGAVMGFALCALALIVLFVLVCLFYLRWPYLEGDNLKVRFDRTVALYEALAGFGLGGSSIALFGRVGGGIYTKAADVGADLVGKVEQGIPEDDPRNPAVIADNVGDNVGDVAGMGADLFGSFAEATCAALVVASTSPSKELALDWTAMNYPLMISAGGLLSCFLTSFVATHIAPVTRKSEIEKSLKYQLFVSTIIMTPVLYGLSVGYLPKEFWVGRCGDCWDTRGLPITVDELCGAIKTCQKVQSYYMFFCGAAGLWSGLAIGLITEYWTSHTYQPVRNLSRTCGETGAATNIILGLALGYNSVIIPSICIAVTIYVSQRLAGMFGIGIAALGILSTLATGLTIDSYGPISDNAGGVAEMCELGDSTRERTDALDAAGNTTAAIGKGFAIGSAAFVSLALFGAFVTRADIEVVDLMAPFPFAGLLIGAMLPYWFSAMTMGAVGRAADEMVHEVQRQFREMPGLMEGTTLPDYERCITISTTASLKEMIALALSS